MKCIERNTNWKIDVGWSDGWEMEPLKQPADIFGSEVGILENSQQYKVAGNTGK